jgi:hypothetical protein
MVITIFIAQNWNYNTEQFSPRQRLECKQDLRASEALGHLDEHPTNDVTLPFKPPTTRETFAKNPLTIFPFSLCSHQIESSRK